MHKVTCDTSKLKEKLSKTMFVVYEMSPLMLEVHFGGKFA